MHLLKNAYEQNLAECIGRPQTADFFHIKKALFELRVVESIQTRPSLTFTVNLSTSQV